MGYANNDDATWTTVPMTNTGGNTWEATIPGQPQGTVVAYWMGVEDIFQQLSGVLPSRCGGRSQPAVLHPGRVCAAGHRRMGTTTVSLATSCWACPRTMRAPGNGPSPSHRLLRTPGDPSTIVQTDEQHTPGGELCFVTGNASNSSAALGRTTWTPAPPRCSSRTSTSGLREPHHHLLALVREQSAQWANPNADWWQVYLSDDNGQTGCRWRTPAPATAAGVAKAFRVQDYVSTGGVVQMKFHASDSLRPGQNLDGGSLVEAALDDAALGQRGRCGIDEQEQAIAAVFPDPADQLLNVRMDLPQARNITVRVTDLGGREVLRKAWGNLSGEQMRT